MTFKINILSILDALLTVIGYIDAGSTFGSFSLRIEGVAFCLAGTAAGIPTIYQSLFNHCSTLKQQLI
jgi:hypothetical protein